MSSLRVVLDTSHQALGLVPVWCSSLNQRHVGHLKRRDDTNRLPHFLNYKHQFLPHHTTGSTELKCLISEMSVMHTLGAIPGTGANPDCGVQWWAWSYAGCRLDSRLQLSYWFALWSFKYPRTLTFWRHTSSDVGLWQWQKMCRCNLEAHRLLVGSVSSHKLGSSFLCTVWLCKS